MPKPRNAAELATKINNTPVQLTVITKPINDDMNVGGYDLRMAQAIDDIWTGFMRRERMGTQPFVFSEVLAVERNTNFDHIIQAITTAAERTRFR